MYLSSIVTSHIHHVLCSPALESEKQSLNRNSVITSQISSSDAENDLK